MGALRRLGGGTNCLVSFAVDFQGRVERVQRDWTGTDRLIRRRQRPF